MRRPTQAVILAGGRGSRLRPITDTIPKGMVEFHGVPFMGHIVHLLREQGITDVLMLLGYLHEVISGHFGDGRDYGVRIRHRVTAPDDLTAHRVLDAIDAIDDSFLLLYCDNYWPMDLEAMWAHHQSMGAPCQITVYANDDGFTRDSVIVEDGMCRVFDRTRTTPNLSGVEISYAILDKATIAPLLPSDRQELFEQAVYPTLAARGDLAAFWSPHRYASVGNHERLPLTDRYLDPERKTVILDRDGTMTVRPPQAHYVTRPEDLEWLPGVPAALARLHDAGYETFIVTNQAGINRGALTAADHQAVTARLLADVEAAGGSIAGVYHCPHDWDEGCTCRKPAPGMLIQVSRDHDVDLRRTFFIGDDERDLQAALAAGAPGVLVTPERPLPDVIDALLAGSLEGQML